MLSMFYVSSAVLFKDFCNLFEEERFLFIIYPLIAFCAAIVLSNHRSKSIMSKAFQSLIQPLVVLYTLLGTLHVLFSWENNFETMSDVAHLLLD